MIARPLKAKIMVFAVFFIGIATGILITNFYETRVTGTVLDAANTGDGASRAQRNVNRMHDYLGLNDGQRQQVNKILEEMRSEVQNLHKETQPRFRSIQEQYRTRIRQEVLTDGQRVKFDEFMRNQQQREQRGNRGRNSDRNFRSQPN